MTLSVACRPFWLPSASGPMPRAIEPSTRPRMRPAMICQPNEVIHFGRRGFLLGASCAVAWDVACDMEILSGKTIAKPALPAQGSTVPKYSVCLCHVLPYVSVGTDSRWNEHPRRL